mgnify:CR=1 FL=1
MIGIVDYGMGNLRSVQKALQSHGADARIVTAPAELPDAEKIVLPGVGAFEDAIARLREHRLAEPICAAIAAGTPFLGICLGYQMLFERSYENGEHTGLGVLGGEVVRFDFADVPDAASLRVPHMGWNQLRPRREGCPLLAGVADGEYMYFAHSFHAAPSEADVVLTETDYGYPFASSVWRENLFATQFHPEKSQAVGLAMVRNFVSHVVACADGPSLTLGNTS